MRTLLDDYLSDEEKGAAAGRNPVSSINEVLREAKFLRDRNKVSCTQYSALNAETRSYSKSFVSLILT